MKLQHDCLKKTVLGQGTLSAYVLVPILVYCVAALLLRRLWIYLAGTLVVQLATGLITNHLSANLM